MAAGQVSVDIRFLRVTASGPDPLGDVRRACGVAVNHPAPAYVPGGRHGGSLKMNGAHVGYGQWEAASARRGDKSGPHSGLTRVTINLTPRSVEALHRACQRLGGNKTDAINHALQVLMVLHELLERNDGRSLVVRQPDGSCERIYLL